MLPDRVSNPGPLTYESGALPIALRGPAKTLEESTSIPWLSSCAFYLVHGDITYSISTLLHPSAEFLVRSPVIIKPILIKDLVFGLQNSHFKSPF